MQTEKHTVNLNTPVNAAQTISTRNISIIQSKYKICGTFLPDRLKKKVRDRNTPDKKLLRKVSSCKDPDLPR